MPRPVQAFHLPASPTAWKRRGWTDLPFATAPDPQTSLTRALTSDASGFTVATPPVASQAWSFIGVSNTYAPSWANSGVVDVGGTHGKVLRQFFADHVKGGRGNAVVFPGNARFSEAWLRFDVCANGAAFTANADGSRGLWGGGGKCMGLGFVLPNSGIAPPTGGYPDPRGGTDRLMWRTQQYGPGNGQINTRGGSAAMANILNLYSYDCTMGNPANVVYGIDRFPASGIPNAQCTFVRSQWHHVDMYVKLNTVTTDATYNSTDGTISGGNYAADGISRVYLDGNLIVESLNRTHRAFKDCLISHLEDSLFYGGDSNLWGPDGASTWDIDNLIVEGVTA